MRSFQTGTGEDLDLLGVDAEAFVGDAGVSQTDPRSGRPSCSRGKAVLVGALAAVALVGATVAWAGQLAHRSAPHSGMILTGGIMELSSQLQDPKGRCLMPEKEFKAGSQLVLGVCKAGVWDQLFRVDNDASTMTLADKSGSVLCVTLSTYENDNGRPLTLELCRPGFYLQRIVGKCLHGDTPRVGTWAFGQPCAPDLPVPLGGTSLFCFMGVLPGSGEVALKDAAESRGSSIFACEASKVYWSEPAGTYAIPDGVFSANVGVFVRIWQEVYTDELYKDHDWTVKVDPDTVWMPARLRDRLGGFGVHIDEAVYAKNTAQFNGFLGPIEIMNQLAIIKLLVVVNECPYNGQSGEDGWLHGCMEDYAGIGFREDVNILNGRCQVDECGDSTFVAFHHYKDPGSWNDCLNRAER